jgi:Domain of unknown function (DUF4082)
MAFTVPEDGIFDDPAVTVSLNQDWLSFLDGVIGFLLSEDLWDGDEETVEFAMQQVRELLALFGPVELPIPAQTFWGNDEPDYEGASAGAGNVGLRFGVVVAGQIIGIRHYRLPGTANGSVGTLYTNAGGVLASADFPDDVTGWIVATFDEPVEIATETLYMAAVYLPDGNSPYEQFVFTSPVAVGDLGAWQDNLSGLRNGTYNTTGSVAFPTLGLNAINFFVDVEFVPA